MACDNVMSTAKMILKMYDGNKQHPVPPFLLFRVTVPSKMIGVYQGNILYI